MEPKLHAVNQMTYMLTDPLTNIFGYARWQFSAIAGGAAPLMLFA
jgi:hypothetical protein